ncbi:MAG: glycoside hydrolase family 3 C-terminal domain-containing protein [Clostridia bacterium]|nr:glycoside hydrolase family 3 C-terminal domain-containing protein [Clostridia bacterium]
MAKQVSQRVKTLLSQMTLEEKVAQMIQVPYAQTGREESLRWAKLGAGSFLHVLGDNAREVQQTALNSRLGIPVLFGIDAVRGHALNDHATIFPTQLACACTWDREIAREMGRVTAREVATDGLHWTFSPLLCLSRDPRWGRVNETFGEDPYLTGEMAAALIHGYQGDDLSAPESIAACAKHYIAYGEATGARDAYDSEVTYRKVREVFLPPFKKAVDAGCATFMTAYGSIDGTPLTVDSYMLKKILREEMGFDGFVITDWMNVTSLVDKQFVAHDADEAAKLAAEAGNDMIMSSTEFYESAIRLVKEGKLSESVIDEAVCHILTVKERMGLFEQPEKVGVPGCIGCEAHQASALEAARRSITLLKNDGVLPLKKEQKVLLVGKNADDIWAQYGDWTYFSHPLWNPDHPAVRPYTTVKEGMERLGQVTYMPGCGPVADESDDLCAALSAAKDADVIVHVVGDVMTQVGEGRDRADLDLSGSQLSLHKALKNTGKPVITVLVSSKPLCLKDAANANAVVVAFNGGQHGGQALAEVLYGHFSPTGRLPISFPHHAGQVPVYYNQLPGWHGASYCDLPAAPLYAFGEGLSYTSFVYSGLTMNADTLTAAVTVENTGSLSGLETVQVYVRDVVSSVLTPIKRLIGYQQVQLAPSEKKEITFRFEKNDFALINRREKTVLEKGEFILMAGHSSKDEDLLKLSFTL